MENEYEFEFEKHTAEELPTWKTRGQWEKKLQDKLMKKKHFDLKKTIYLIREDTYEKKRTQKDKSKMQVDKK